MYNRNDTEKINEIEKEAQKKKKNNIKKEA